VGSGRPKKSKQKIDYSNLINHRGIILTDEITSPVSSTDEITPRYSHYLYFTVSERTIRLAFFHDKYTPEQEQTHSLIKSLHDDGMGYRKIAEYLNQRRVRIIKGNKWFYTQVYSVLKRFRDDKRDWNS